MIGLAIPLTYLAVEVAMYWVYRKWVARVKSDIDNLLRVTRLQSDQSEAAVLRFSDRRRKAIWGIVIILLVFFFLLASYVGIGIPAEPQEDLSQRVLAMTLVMIICGLGPWFILLEPVGNVRIVTKNGIYKRSPWTGKSFAEWKEIESVRWIPIIDNFLVKTRSDMFAVNPVYENLNVFADSLMSNVSRSKWLAAERMLRRALRGPFQP